MSSASSIPASDRSPDPGSREPGGHAGKVRAALSHDAWAIAAVHVASWRVAYRGLLPDDYLDHLSIEERAGLWSGVLTDPSPGHVVVVEIEDDIVGFAHVGPSGDDDARPMTGELYTIYVQPDAWGRGHGRELGEAALEFLTGDGYHEATLWMLSTNDRARRFYLRQGWSPVPGERSQEFGGQVVTDHRFGRSLAPRTTTPSLGSQPQGQIFSRPAQ
jgi:GNAT superfamily N-acetyltransferase